MMSELFKQSGFWVLIFLLACAVIKLVGSLLLKKKLKAFYSLMTKVVTERKLQKEEKILLNGLMDDTRTKMIWVIAPFSFFFFLAAIFMGLVLMKNPKNKAHYNPLSIKSFNDQCDIEQQRYDDLLAISATKEIGIDPSKTKIWNDGSYAKLDDMVIDISFLRSPILLCLIIFNALLSIPFLLIAFLFSVSLYQISEYLWWPLRIPITRFLDRHYKVKHNIIIR